MWRNGSLEDIRNAVEKMPMMLRTPRPCRNEGELRLDGCSKTRRAACGHMRRRSLSANWAAILRITSLPCVDILYLAILISWR